jgi:hypothetical protein
MSPTNSRENSSLTEAIQVPLQKEPSIKRYKVDHTQGRPNPIYVQRPKRNATDQNNIAAPGTNVKPRS